MFNKILIANRGEIACRIIKTARRMGIETVAIYSTADRESLHVLRADEAFCVGPPPALESYLNIETIIKIAKNSGAQAIHPGYGFLSESPQLAQACADAGITFIGPSISAMEAMASKQLAKQLLEKTSVPLTPGYHGIEQSDTRLLEEAQRIGCPILLKAANGGGGKGMRTVHNLAEFEQALAGARREALAYFGDATLLIEKLITNPRHIELQIMADNHGHVVHLFERDCSIQRRHQKIIEEAPAPHLSQKLRQALAKAAINVAEAIEYRGAGTIEFLLDEQEQFYFMEMNTRLQVEHPVTEMITGLDLVEWQLRIAANEALPLQQEQIRAKGHAIECRIYAEDPCNQFMPSVGQVHFLKEPVGEHIRLDSGIQCQDWVTPYYDSMLAKLIAWGETRTEALERLCAALKHYHIGGIKTNINFLRSILRQTDFVQGCLSTAFLTQHSINIPKPDKQLALSMAACVDYLTIFPQHDHLQMDTFGWQMQGNRYWNLRYFIQDELLEVKVFPFNHHQIRLQQEDTYEEFHIRIRDQVLFLENDARSMQVWFERVDDNLIFYTELGSIQAKRFNWQDHTSNVHATDNHLAAPMSATIVALLKKPGDIINAGDALIVLEAMKMEHTIHAPYQGILTQFLYDVGTQVTEGAELVTIDKQGS
jgi:3-methylcrotonyl-CoA carboxylase alpha subunit